MTDPTHPEFSQEPEGELDPALLALLSSPSVWAEPPPDGQESVVQAIAHERGMGHQATSGSSRRIWRLGAVAAAVLIAGVATVGAIASTRDGTSGGIAVALAGADPAGSMTATATVERTAGGVKIVLDPRELPPAEPGSYYHAWLTNDRDRVSAGTFHLRGGPGTIELWCGVDDPTYRTLTVTLEQVAGQPVELEPTARHGDEQPVVLVGRIDG